MTTTGSPSRTVSDASAVLTKVSIGPVTLALIRDPLRGLVGLAAAFERTPRRPRRQPDGRPRTSELRPGPPSNGVAAAIRMVVELAAVGVFLLLVAVAA